LGLAGAEHKKIWSSNDTSTPAKVKVYEKLVLSALLYNAKTWSIKQESKKRLLVFEVAFLRRIAGVSRKDRGIQKFGRAWECNVTLSRKSKKDVYSTLEI